MSSRAVRFRLHRSPHIAAAVLIVLALFLPGCQKKPAAVNANAANGVALRDVVLYFEAADLLLNSEVRRLPLPSNDAAAITAVLRELLKGPSNPQFGRAFPLDTVVRAAFLLPDGTAIVDLGGGTLSQGWNTGSHEELMAVYSVVQTVTGNFPKARRVRLLMNGAPVETLGGHLAADRSLAPIAALVHR